MRWSFSFGLLCAMAAAPVAPWPGEHLAAQSTTLNQVDSLVAAADYDRARAALEDWLASREATRADERERARALLLRARLAPDFPSAESDYLSLVLGYPLSPYTPEGLLRLGQGLLAANEPVRATGYLARLVADYPGRPERSLAMLWLARAQLAARQLAAACNTARNALRDTSDPDLASLIRHEEQVACAAASGDEARAIATTTPATAPEPPPAAAPARDTHTMPARDQADPDGRFTVQTGAFRQQATIDATVARLRRAGYDPRVVTVPANALVRVRIGRFGSRQEAERLMNQLRRDGFDAIVVADAIQERPR